ncbi:MAG TPA: serine--tRNA ligase, partial [Planctomycetaceae bacterium]|nr:serine--tRNA ligase [Planctomycetaceae bacterium]
MLDLQFLCDHIDQVAENCRNRGVSVDLDALLNLKNRRGELILEVDQLRREQNEVSAQIPKEKDAAQKQALIARGKELRQQVADREGGLKEAEAALRAVQTQIPNMTHPAAPVGRLAEDNKVIRTWGTKPKFDFKPLDHVTLAEKHNLIDLEAGARVAGHGFYFLKNEA